MLTVQYRMNEAIMHWSSESMYDNKLLAHSSVAKHLLSDSPDLGVPNSCGDFEKEDLTYYLTHPIHLIDTSGAYMFESVEAVTKSKSNHGEAMIVVSLLLSLQKIGIKKSQVGVITPYNAQVSLIRKYVNQTFDEGLEYEINTVDGFQGSERDIIIISMVRANRNNQLGFLENNRRMNVAVTRARK